MDQGTIEWRLDRMGCVTASAFHKVLGSHAVRTTYYNTLVEEREALDKGRDYAIAFIQANDYDSPAMAWGRKYEDAARAHYELTQDEDVLQVPFLRLPGSNTIGCSLDGKVGDRGTIEIKCPFTLENHIKTCAGGMPVQHLDQVQGGLWITGRAYCDFISYHPTYTARPLYIERIERNDEYIEMLARRVTEFAEALDSGAGLPEYVPEATDEVPSLF